MSDPDLRPRADQVPGVILYQIVRGTDGSRCCTYMSAGVERVIGLTPAQVIADARVLDAMILDDDRARLQAVAEAARGTMTPYEIEIRVRTVSGDVRWLLCRAIPRRREGDGAVAYHAAALRAPRAECPDARRPRR